MLRNKLAFALGTSLAIAAGTPALCKELLGPKTSFPSCNGKYAQALGLVDGGNGVACSQGFSHITHPSTGLFCFTISPSVLAHPPVQKAPVVSVDWHGSKGVALFAEWDSANADCTGATNATLEVRTYKADTGGVGSPLQTPVLSDDVAFVILLP